MPEDRTRLQIGDAGGSGSMNRSHKKRLARLCIGFAFLLLAVFLPTERIVGEDYGRYVNLGLYLIPYLVIGGDVLLRAGRNILRGRIFDENFLMTVATIGALALGDYTEATAVMLFYQVGELFQDVAVSRSRGSIAELMDIRPDYANAQREGQLVKLDPEEIKIGEIIVIRPGERVPLDGVIVEGDSQLDTAALTGESIPRNFSAGDDIISGAVNLTGLLRVRVSKPFGESTVSRILELVESAGEKKAKVENFITRFAGYYTPIVCGLALALAVLPPLLFAQSWGTWVERGLIFLVVSCPCALVISVPMSFFGGIGGASRQGILVKGSSYLEVLSKADTVVFDKTGTLTTGSFEVTKICAENMSEQELLELAAYAENDSTHPIALSILSTYGGEIYRDRIETVEEISGRGIRVVMDGKTILVGNGLLMSDWNVAFRDCEVAGTTVHVAVDGVYAGHIIIADSLKQDSRQTIEELKRLGVGKTVILTGDKKAVAEAVAMSLGVDQFYAELLPQDKVETLEKLLLAKKPNTSLVFVGDGINDAPVLARADVGIAMGAMGSDAAIEAADIVLMDDKPSNITVAVGIARKTMGVVKQNILFALGIKLIVLILAGFGIANMWLAVFADVGVAFLAIINAMRCLKFNRQN